MLEQQQEPACGHAQLAPWESLAAALEARWSQPHTLLEHEKKTQFLLSGSAQCLYGAITASDSLFTLFI